MLEFEQIINTANTLQCAVRRQCSRFQIQEASHRGYQPVQVPPRTCEELLRRPAHGGFQSPWWHPIEISQAGWGEGLPLQLTSRGEPKMETHSLGSENRTRKNLSRRVSDNIIEHPAQTYRG